MFDVGWSEMLIVGALALIVVGPKDLPRMMRSVGNFVGQARGMARQFQRSMEDAAKEADLSDLKEARDLMTDVRKATSGGGSFSDPFKKIADSFEEDIADEPEKKSNARTSEPAPKPAAKPKPAAEPKADPAPTAPEPATAASETASDRSEEMKSG